MLASLAPLISRGVIDNTSRDITHLHLWGVDKGEPMEFVIQGNCLPDIAGCRVTFENHACIHTRREEHPVLHRMRELCGKETLAGDMTLSRRVPEQDNRRALQNLLSLEFFPGTKLRILIESLDYSFDISLPQWEMSDAEATAQRFLNRENMRAHVAVNIAQFCGPGMVDIRNGKYPWSTWDETLNRAEAGMAIFPTVREKYRFDPDRRTAEAYVMGRDDLLGDLATEDEAHLPPDTSGEKNWEVVDFLRPEEAQKVREAMQLPLFTETSRVTMLIQKQLMRNGQPQGEEAERFVNTYAAAVSHILAALLSTYKETFILTDMLKRVELISRSIGNLPAMLSSVPPEGAALIREALAALLTQLDTFAASIRR